MRLWLTTTTDEHIDRSKITFISSVGDKNKLTLDVSILCHELDIPTPIISNFKYDCLNKFNFVKFKPNEFVESVNFDFLTLEIIADE